jgi:hypothetical protein
MTDVCPNRLEQAEQIYILSDPGTTSESAGPERISEISYPDRTASSPSEKMS